MTLDRHRPFGNTGLFVPPLMFSTAALGNVHRVIAEQTKFEICGQWFQHVAPPLFLDASTDYGGGLALEVLRRALGRFDIDREEVVVNLRLSVRNDHTEDLPELVELFLRQWHYAGRLLGDSYLPSLVSIDYAKVHSSEAGSPPQRNKRLTDILKAQEALRELKSRGELRGIGLVVNDWRLAEQILSQAEFDWLMLVGGFTIMRHPPELLDFLRSLSARQIPMVVTSVFHCGFLVGGNICDGRVVHPDDSDDRLLFTWRKAFAALCHGHGVSPAHACIQFALSAPGVVSVAVDTSHPDRIAENAAASCTPIPPSFWQSMREEGLLSEEYPYLG